MSSLYHHFVFNPLYNALIAIFTFVPWADAGVAVILITIVVRVILFPLSQKAVVAQVKMQQISKDLQNIKDKYKDNKEEQARQTLALYKDKGVNPFSGILVLLIQLPVIFALYGIFLYTGFPKVDTEILYSFIHIPENISAVFLGMDLTKKSAILALLAAIATFFQMRLATARMPLPAKGKGDASFGDNLAQSMQTQMKYFLPVLVFFIAYKISGVIALYWLTTNLFTIGQELLVRKRLSTLTA
ncbi:YidC/Oxa1 family membrane protein insertase [Candidatus Parcubacteria bacterium]|nr:YidC/Oxa1 family membrane protein insertase [Candidatus Parcubacteria bacterium]